MEIINRCTSSICAGEYSGERDVIHTEVPYMKADSDSKQSDFCSNLPLQNRPAVKKQTTAMKLKDACSLEGKLWST